MKVITRDCGLCVEGSGPFRRWGRNATPSKPVAWAPSFVSAVLIYEGYFVNNKFHDLTGKATCSVGSTVRYVGGFEDGHYSGHGVQSHMVNGQWIVIFDGSWLRGLPWSGKNFDISGNVISTVEGGVVNIGGKPALSNVPASPAMMGASPKNASPSADPKSPPWVTRGTRVYPTVDAADKPDGEIYSALFTSP